MVKDEDGSILRLMLSMYLGERCKFCGKQYTELEDLDDTVWAGSHEHGRLACKSCWETTRMNVRCGDCKVLRKGKCPASEYKRDESNAVILSCIHWPEKRWEGEK